MKTIGIVGDRQTFRNENYYAAVEACGAGTETLDVYEGTGRVFELDGIILPGGADVDPALYHEGNTASRELNRRLDWYELAVLSEAVKFKKPVLGICRGHQIINVFFGGSLIQNVEHCEKHDYKEDKSDRVHGNVVLRDTFIYDIFKEDSIVTNSAHHQAVMRLGEGMNVAQYSDDGLIEAAFHSELPVFGVQWHPERMCLKNKRPDTVDGIKVFEFFVSVINSGEWKRHNTQPIEYYI
ncbi:MAG: type 1 glutamine amidotransferase [Lachnospiraceae bacterium]|nr:type 1 glutamine amidotransferase [Lachnospiraceae bacterium]